MVDRIKPLKLESSASGGTETDIFPTSLDKNEDLVDCRGVTIQDSSTSDDETVIITRDGSSNMTFADGNVTTKKLSELYTMKDSTGGYVAPVTNGRRVRAYHSGGIMYVDMYHDGTDAKVRTTSGNLIFEAGSKVVLKDSLQLLSATVSKLPSASPAGQLIYVSDESGGAVPAFSDGTNWRRVTDRVIVS